MEFLLLWPASGFLGWLWICADLGRRRYQGDVHALEVTPWNLLVALILTMIMGPLVLLVWLRSLK